MAPWVADGAQTRIWKRQWAVEATGGTSQVPPSYAAQMVQWGVNLKAADATPPTIREVAVGPDNQAAGNEARNRTIRVRDGA